MIIKCGVIILKKWIGLCGMRKQVYFVKSVLKSSIFLEDNIIVENVALLFARYMQKIKFFCLNLGIWIKKEFVILVLIIQIQLKYFINVKKEIFSVLRVAN